MARIPVDRLPQPCSFARLREQNETLREALRWAEDRIQKLEGKLIAATNKATHPPGWRQDNCGVCHYAPDGFHAICGMDALLGTAVERLDLACGEQACIECLVQVEPDKIGWDRS